jgi:hypothetical protein
MRRFFRARRRYFARGFCHEGSASRRSIVRDAPSLDDE